MTILTNTKISTMLGMAVAAVSCNVQQASAQASHCSMSTSTYVTYSGPRHHEPVVRVLPAPMTYTRYAPARARVVRPAVQYRVVQPTVQYIERAPVVEYIRPVRHRRVTYVSRPIRHVVPVRHVRRSHHRPAFRSHWSSHPRRAYRHGYRTRGFGVGYSRGHHGGGFSIRVGH